MINRIQRYFVAGILTILPLSISIYIFVVLFRLVDGILGRFLNAYFKEWLGFYIPGLGLILFIVIIFLAGVVSSHFFGKGLHHVLDKLISHFPLVKHIYPSIKKIFEFVFSETRLGFKKAVLIEYPSHGIWSLAFIANEGFKEAEGKTGQSLLNVYVPSVPNPTTGYFVFIPRDKVTVLDISMKEAMRLVVSGGLLNPSDFVKDS